MLRFALLAILIPLLARMFWNAVDHFIAGLGGGPDRHASSRPQAPPPGIQMARDPVCGTFVQPERTVTLLDGRSRVFFCSDACRDKYRAGQARVEGRTA
jgi:YHS domain-containing protein